MERVCLLCKYPELHPQLLPGRGLPAMVCTAKAVGGQWMYWCALANR